MGRLPHPPADLPPRLRRRQCPGRFPTWLSGNFTVSDVVLGYNRIFVIGFAAVIVFPHLGSSSHAPRSASSSAPSCRIANMAACRASARSVSICSPSPSAAASPAWPGAFLSQIGNVGPNLGQNYIVDCFMTVVVGGVGNLFGTVYSALGIGAIDEISSRSSALPSSARSPCSSASSSSSSGVPPASSQPRAAASRVESTGITYAPEDHLEGELIAILVCALIALVLIPCLTPLSRSPATFTSRTSPSISG